MTGVSSEQRAQLRDVYASMDERAAARHVAQRAAERGLTLLSVGPNAWTVMNARARTVVVAGDDGGGLPLAVLARLLGSLTTPP